MKLIRNILILALLYMRAFNAMAVDWPEHYNYFPDYISDYPWFDPPTVGWDNQRNQAEALHISGLILPANEVAFDAVYDAIGYEYPIEKLRPDQQAGSKSGPITFKAAYSENSIYVLIKYGGSKNDEMMAEVMLCPYDMLQNAPVSPYSYFYEGTIWLRYLELGGFKVSAKIENDDFVLNDFMGCANGVNGYIPEIVAHHDVILSDCSSTTETKIAFKIDFKALKNTLQSIDFTHEAWRNACDGAGISFDVKLGVAEGEEYLWNSMSNDVYYSNSYAGYLMRGYCEEIVEQGTTGALDWKLNCNGILTISGNGAMDDYAPASAPWYDFREQIYRLVIEDGVTKIGAYAFDECNNLTVVTIGANVTTIEESAFPNNNALTTLNYNAANCTSGWSFQYCDNLATVNFGYTVKSIPANAFANCRRLTYIAIPGGVTSIGEGAFSYCTSLTTVYYGATNCTAMGNADDIVFLGSKLSEVVIGYGVESIPAYAFSYCTELTTVFYEAENCTAMGEGLGAYAFYKCSNLSNIYIDYGVRNIPPYAFAGCSGLTYVHYGAENCTAMGSVDAPVFYGCNNLSNIYIDDWVKNIPSYAFSDCNGLNFIRIPHGVTSIGEGVFANCTGLTTISYEAINCTTMGSADAPVFSGCSKLSAVDVGYWVETIPDYAFSGSALSTIYVSGSVTSIGEYAFFNCANLTAITVETNNPNYIAENNILYDKTKSILLKYPAKKAGASFTIPNNVITIENNAFQSCTGLTSVIIPKSVTGVENYAFENCSGLTSVICRALEPPAVGGANTFNGIKTNCVLRVPAGCKESYEKATGWKEFLFIEDPPLVITALPSPRYGGSVTGISAIYDYDDNMEITAQANKGYEFKLWLEEKNTVSTSFKYSFTITAPRTLYAVFTPKENADETIDVSVALSSATITWAEVTDAATYTLIIYSNASRTNETDRFQSNGDLLYTVQNLTPGTQYYYTLTSYDGDEYPLTISVGDFTTWNIGIDESVAAGTASIYPNPVTESFYITGIEENTPITLLDATGKVVLRTVIAPEEIVSVAHLSQGVYILQVAGKAVKVIRN